MKLTWILFAAALPVLAQQPGFDFKSLDKLGANAKDATSINLEGDALKAATGFFGDKLRNLTGVYVHSYEFAKTGQYNVQDLEPVRAYLRTLNWTKIVESKEDDETSEIYMKPLPNGKIAGLAVVVAEPKEVTVVFVSGEIDPADLNNLGNLGIPNIQLDHGGRPDAPKKD
jgi:hypothetical protein